MALNVTIEASGKTQGDLELALEEALRLIREGNNQGFNRNEDGSFHFDVEGEEEPDGEEQE